MRFSRRDFLKRAGWSVGAAALPSWVLEVETAEADAIDKNRLADAAMATARKLGASYADVRINRYRNETIATREQQVQRVSRSQSLGFGVRVLLKGTWGFAASSILTPEEVRRVAELAADIARANYAYQRTPVQLAPVSKIVAKWKSAFSADPFNVPLDGKIQFLLNLNETAMKPKGVSFVDSSLDFMNEDKFFVSSEGSRIEQYIIRSSPEFAVTVVSKEAGGFQTRRSLASPKSMGFEYLDSYPWLREAEQAGEEAAQKLSARTVEPGKYDLVLHPSHLWLTIHESVGHSTELDRALGWEADYAGTSFLTPDKAGKLQFGSRLINFVADRTQPAGLATVGYDDDGVPGQSWHLVRDGVFVDWQTTRDLAPLIGRKSSYGCSYADSWRSVPFARMPNVSLQPSRENVSQDDLIAGVDKGILIYGDGSYSIDQQRYNFQFGGQTFWEIRNGKIVGILRDVAYQARTTDFWGACDGLGGPATYWLGGALADGKGEPTQLNAVSHGCPVARFRQINVLNTASEPRA